jgi:hypothetical protein
MEYMPDYSDQEFPERKFMYGIIGTLYPEEMANLVQQCREKRAIQSREDKDQLIEITEEIQKEIDNLLTFPSKFVDAHLLIYL